MGAAPKPAFFRMTLGEFRRSHFVGKPPCMNTLKAMVERGEYLGEKTATGRVFIFVDEQGQPLRATTAPVSTGNPAADAAISEWIKSR